MSIGYQNKNDRLAFLSPDEVGSLPLENMIRALRNGHHLRFHVLAAEDATIENNALLHFFEDELDWEFIRGNDRLEDAIDNARLITESYTGDIGVRTVVWDCREEKTLWDSEEN